MANSEVRTLYDRKKLNLLNKLYDISRMLCLVAFRLFQACFYSFCSCNRYASLVAVFILPSSCVCFYYFAHGTKNSRSVREIKKIQSVLHSEKIQRVCQTL